MSPGKQSIHLSSNIDRVIIKYYRDGAVNNLVWQSVLYVKDCAHTTRGGKKNNKKTTTEGVFWHHLVFFFFFSLIKIWPHWSYKTLKPTFQHMLTHCQDPVAARTQCWSRVLSHLRRLEKALCCLSPLHGLAQGAARLPGRCARLWFYFAGSRLNRKPVGIGNGLF